MLLLLWHFPSCGTATPSYGTVSIRKTQTHAGFSLSWCIDTVSTDTDESGEPVTGRAAVKFPRGTHASHRLTPPIEVREAVNMEADEPWMWVYHPATDKFWIRRAGVGFEGLPDNSVAVGTAEARQTNPSYLDFAIPVPAVDIADLSKGDAFEFLVLDDNTIRMTPTDDDE